MANDEKHNDLGPPAAAEETPAPAPEKKEPGNTIACVAYTPLLFFVPFLSEKKDDAVAQNSARQGALLLILFTAITVFEPLLARVLPLGWFAYYSTIMTCLRVALLVLMAAGMIRAYNNKIFRLPVIGHLDVFKMLKGE